MSFEEFKKMWKETTGVNPNDLQAAKNLKCSIKYVSKEDIKCVYKGIDQDFLSLNTKAYIAAKDGPFNIRRYPYPNLCRSQQVQFKELVENYRRDIEVDMTNWEDIELYPWQKFIIKKLEEQNDREIIWINDPEGVTVTYPTSIQSMILACFELIR